MISLPVTWPQASVLAVSPKISSPAPPCHAYPTFIMISSLFSDQSDHVLNCSSTHCCPQYSYAVAPIRHFQKKAGISVLTALPQIWHTEPTHNEQGLEVCWGFWVCGWSSAIYVRLGKGMGGNVCAVQNPHTAHSYFMAVFLMGRAMAWAWLVSTKTFLPG